MTQTLRSMIDEYDDIASAVLTADGELSPELEARLDALTLKAEEKIERVALYILRERSRAKQVKDEEARLGARRAAYERTAESLTGYLDACLRALGKTKVDGLLCTVAIQQNNPSVHAPEWDEEALRGMFVYAPQFVTRTPETFTLNKKALLEAHRAGQPIPEKVEIVRTSSVRIR